ncbi:MAG: tetratricopeptide repeat protein, partial [Pseudomonadota bacterium]
LPALDVEQRDWDGALETLAVARKHGHIEKASADRRRAVLLTAQAQVAEEGDPERAMKLAEEAHGLAPDLVPATAIAGRLLAARGNVKKATKVLQMGWRKGPHPDIAIAYAYARIGDSPRDRLARTQQLAALSPHSIESPVAVANAALDAKDFAAARQALEPFLESGRLTQRIATLMAKIEGEDGNTGKVREWLARAVHAEPSPVWTADGVVADDWGPISPVTGALDAFQWRVPAETDGGKDLALTTARVEELVRLGASEVPSTDEGDAAVADVAESAKDVTAAGIATAAAAAVTVPAAASPAVDPPARPEPEPAPAEVKSEPAPKPVEAEVIDVEPVTKPVPAPVAAAAAPTPVAVKADEAPPNKADPKPEASADARPAVTATAAASNGSSRGNGAKAPVVDVETTSKPKDAGGDAQSAAAIAARAATAASNARARSAEK